LTHLLIGALTEAAIFIAHADDQPAARREAGENAVQLLSGLCIDNRKRLVGNGLPRVLSPGYD